MPVAETDSASRSGVCFRGCLRGVRAGCLCRFRERRVGRGAPGRNGRSRSPALIEGVRSAVSDGAGQYRIIDLRPGTYILTFALPGFTTVRREGWSWPDRASSTWTRSWASAASRKP